MASKKKQKKGPLTTAKRLLNHVKMPSSKLLKHKLDGKSSKKTGKTRRRGKTGRRGKRGRTGKGLFGFIEDTTIGSCLTPVKKCSDENSDENTNCRNYYYLDNDNNIYRPCRNPKKNMIDVDQQQVHIIINVWKNINKIILIKWKC